ncbi:hypothetical protein [Mesorhizobium sp. M0276]|uniref:hypothetical protein n=1 Tax=Mesorhizobium sp. M0276 TaxID=2956928 RepID=UPI00333CC498
MSAPAKRKKASYIGVPAVFKFDLACKHINDAYGGFGCYVVGSALERPDWRDVDVVLILEDEAFKREFPGTSHSTFEFDTKWLIHTVAISEWLKAQTGLPIAFKIQPQTWANKTHSTKEGKRRNAIGLRFAREIDE